MKILLIIKNFDFGGAENHVCELANALHEAGHNVWIASGKGEQQNRLVSGITSVSIEYSDFKIIKNLISIYKLVQREKFDIIHAHQHLPILIASIISKITKVSVIATIHGRIRHDLPYRFEKKVIKKVIAISENGLRGLLNQPSLKKKAVLIRNGVSFPEHITSNYASNLSFYYVSRIDKRHSLLIQHILLNVWPTISKKYPSAKFVIIGNGYYLDELKKLVNSESYNFKNGVRFTGFYHNIVAEINNASLVLGVGRVAIKSLANGIPVFSIKHNRIGEVVTTKNFAKLSYGNFVAIDGVVPTSTKIIEIIDDFIANQQYYKNETIAIQMLMNELYSIEIATQLTINLYNEVLENDSRN